jgi:hypothetical protein
MNKPPLIANLIKMSDLRLLQKLLMSANSAISNLMIKFTPVAAIL